MAWPLPDDGCGQAPDNKTVFYPTKHFYFEWVIIHQVTDTRSHQNTAGTYQKSLLQFFVTNVLRRLTTCGRRIVAMMMNVNPQGQVWIAHKVNISPHDLCNTSFWTLEALLMHVDKLICVISFHPQCCRGLTARSRPQHPPSTSLKTTHVMLCLLTNFGDD